MKRSEALTKYYDGIIETMVEDYYYVLKGDGGSQYKIYVWEDGEIEELTGVQGDNVWLQPRDCEPRELFFVCTVAEDPSFDIWDASGETPPDNETEREVLRDVLIEGLLAGYRERIREVLDTIIEDAEWEERMDA